MNLQSIISRVWPVLLAIFAALWFSGISAKLLPQSASEWGLIVELTSGESGEARLYWETEEGLSQDRSQGLPIVAGERSRLFFPLPRNAELNGFRLDPLDHAEGTPEITIHHLDAVGPMGFWFAEKPGVKDIKARADVEVEELDDEQLLVRVAGPNPQLRISVSPKPLPAPEAEFDRASMVIGVVAFLIFAALFLLIHTMDRLREGLLYLAGLGWAVYLVAHYVVPVRVIDPIWCYHVLFTPSLFLCILAAPGSWNCVKPLLKHPPMWALAAFVLYFGLSALGLSGDSVPTRSTVLLNLGIILVAPAMFLYLKDFFRFDDSWTRLIWIGVASATALVMLILCYGVEGAAFTQRLYQHTILSDDQHTFTPLYRAISGTACFAMALVLGLSWADQREGGPARPNPKRLTIYLAASMPLMLYTLFSQSRGIVIGLMAGLIVLSLAPRAWTSRAAASLFLALGLLFAFGTLPEALNGISGRGNPPPPPSLEQEQPPNPTAGSMVVRSASGRPTIWKAYLGEISKNPILGHGLGGKQKIPVELSEDLFAPQDAALAHTEWNPHSVHLSVLYFGGVIGFLIHAALLGSIFFFAIKRCRESGDSSFLLSAAWITLAAVGVAFESTLIAYDKEPVLLRHPNEYWIFYWGAIIFGIVQTSLKPANSEK